MNKTTFLLPWCIQFGGERQTVSKQRNRSVVGKVVMSVKKKTKAWKGGEGEMVLF